MKVINKMVSVFLLGAALFAFASCADSISSYEDAKITAITFNNKGVTASIDESAKKISIVYKDGTDLSELKATKISVSEGTVVDTKLADLDFTKSPVLFEVSSSNGKVIYVAEVRKLGSVIAKNAIQFTEYYNGATYNYKGANNQFLEISNLSDDTLDISEVYLNRHVWVNGQRRKDLDQSIPLTGIELESGKCLVMYNQRCSWFSSKTNAVYRSDADFNSIISFSGQDAFTLTYNGKVIDAIGPDDGEGTGLSWGKEKQMQRKAFGYSSYKESQWLTTSVTDSSSDVANTVGKSSVATNSTTYKSATGQSLTYMAFEKSTDYNKITIDEAEHTVTVTYFRNDFSKIQYPAVSSDGNSISLVIGGKTVTGKIESGVTEVDFSKKNIVFRVVSSKDAALHQDYSVIVETVLYNMESNVSGSYARVDAGDIKDGDIILMACPAQDSFIGSSPSGTALAAVDESLEDIITYMGNMAAFCVTVKEGYYFFTFKGKFLTSKTNSSLSFEGAPTDDSSWKFSKGDNGTLVKNKSGRAIEYYKSAYGSYTGSGDDYEFIFYKKL